MEQRQFTELVEKAESDPSFLHRMIFSPETLISELKGSLDRQALGALIAMQPAEIIARTVGISQYCGNTCTSSCDNTCGGSCGYTTNFSEAVTGKAGIPFFSRSRGQLEGCGNTCTSSCDNTCGGSCGYTTNLTDFAQRFGQNFQAFR
jgi:hypothetical protein